MARNLQFSASYLALEDRLQLLAVFPDEVEVHLLLTRRLTEKFLANIESISGRLTPANAATPEAKRQVTEFVREAAIAQADYRQAFNAGKVHPLMADGPKLVKSASMEPRNQNELALRFGLVPTGRVDMTIPTRALWALAHLLQQLAGTAKWNLAPNADRAGEDEPSKLRLN